MTSTVVAFTPSKDTLTFDRASTTNSNANLTVSPNTSGLFIGMVVTGSGIPDGTIITGLSSTTAVLSKSATNSTTADRTFTKSAYEVPPNPLLCASTLSPISSGSVVDNFGAIIIEEGSGSIVLTPIGRSQIANCNVTLGSEKVTLSSGNTNSLYVGQSVTGVGFTGITATIKSIPSSNTFHLTEKASATATNTTYTLGLEHQNLQNTNGNVIKCFDDLTQTGININSVNLDTHHLFAMIHSNDSSKHHFARVKEKLNDDVVGDSFEFEPKLGNEVSKGIKFKLYSTPIPTDKTIVAVGLGIKNSIGHNAGLSRPLFYFFDENTDKKNQLDHNKKYNILYSELDFFSAGTDTLTTTSFFTTMQDFGFEVIDYSRFSLRTRLVDRLRELDSPVVMNTVNGNEGGIPLPDYTPFDRDSCFCHARRDDDDEVTNLATQNYTGPIRYLSYNLSKDKANLSYNVIDQLLYESMGAKGSLAEVKIADPFRIITTKMGDNEPLRIRQQLFTGDFNEFKTFNASIVSNAGGTVYNIRTDHDLGSYLNIGDEVRVGSRILVVDALGSFSNTAQTITFDTYHRLETESSFTVGSVPTLANGSSLERRAYNKRDKTLLTDFPLIDNREADLYVKLLSKEFSFLYASVTSTDAEKKLITLDFSNKAYYDSDGNTSNEHEYHAQGTMLDYMDGQYAILVEKIDGTVERIDNYKENGLTQVKLAGRSKIRQLISPIINKNTLFSQDIIYSTQSPYNKLVSVGVNFTCEFDSKTLTASGSITLATGDKVYLKHASGMMGYIGEISLGKTDTSFTLVDKARAQGTTLAGFKESNKSYMLNKALATNNFVDSTTSLSGASSKGLIFDSGVKITSTGEEGDILIGSSGSDNENATGYFLSDVANMKSDSHFQTILEDENGNSETFDTVNTLIDFEIVNTKSAGENKGTIVTIAPYNPLTLGRVDINYANTQDTDFTLVGKLTHNMTLARRFIEVDSDTALSSFNNIRGEKNLHGKPLFVNGKFLANILQVEKDINVTVNATTVANGDATLTVDTSKLSAGMVIDNTTHSNIPSSATITFVSSDSVEMSINANGVSASPTEFSLASNQCRIILDRAVGVHSFIRASVVAGSPVVKNVDTEKLFVGMRVIGTGLTVGTTYLIESINKEERSITLDNNAELTINVTTVFTAFFQSGMSIDRLEGHHNQDDVRETTKFTHELNLLNGGHLHGGKNIALLHPQVNQLNVNNITSVLDFKLEAEHPVMYQSGTRAHGLSTSARVDRLGSYQSQFGSSNYRLINLEKGNFNKSKQLLFDNSTMYEDQTSKIKYYASAYRYNAGQYVDGIRQDNIIGTDICQRNFIGEGRIETVSGNSVIDITVEAFISGSTNSFFHNVFKVGQKITGTGIPDNTFIGATVGDGASGDLVLQAKLVTLEGTAVNATASNTSITASFFSFDNKRILESRGFLPSIGDRFFEPTTLEQFHSNPFELTQFRQGGKPKIFYTPHAHTKLATYGPSSYPNLRPTNNNKVRHLNSHQYRDKFEQIDPKVARMFLFSNSDLLPYSSTRKDSLLNRTKDRNIVNYSLLTVGELNITNHSELKEGSKGITNTITALDDSYRQHNILSAFDNKEINKLRRFSIMRLTELVFDCFYNQFDPENIPESTKNIGSINLYPQHTITSLNMHVTNVSGKVLTVAANPTTTVQPEDIIVDRAGRFIGVVASTSSNSITLIDKPHRTIISGATNAVAHYQPTVPRQDGSAPNGAIMYICVIKHATTNQALEQVIACQTVNGSKTVTVLSASNMDKIHVGMTVTGNGVQTTFTDRVASIDFASNQFELLFNSNSSQNPTNLTFRNKQGTANISGYNTQNDFIQGDGDINPMQFVTMRGLASDGGGFPNNYVSAFTPQGQGTGTGAARGNNDSGYGGNSANFCDTSFSDRVGVNAMGGSVTNFAQDNSIILPMVLTSERFSYFSWLAEFSKFTGTTSLASLTNFSPFPMMSELANTLSTPQSTQSAFGITKHNASNFQNMIHKATVRKYQGFIPVFLDRWGITGGNGAKVDIGMAATKIGSARNLNIDGSIKQEIRYGLSTVTRTRDTEGNVFGDQIGFATKTLSTDKFNGGRLDSGTLTDFDTDKEYDDDADGVFGGFKPTLRIDVGFKTSCVFNTVTATAARLEDTNNQIHDDEEFTSLGGGSEVYLYVDSPNVPFFTRTHEISTFPTPDTVTMSNNATISGTADAIFSRNKVGTKKATNGTDVTVLAFTDYFLTTNAGSNNTSETHIRADNPLWLSHVDLTGCYLVSEEVKIDDGDGGVEDYETANKGGSRSIDNVLSHNASIDLGTPNHILYVISHEIDTTRRDRTHILTVSGNFPSEKSSALDPSRLKTFRIMQPNHTCFYDFSPKKIRLNQLSSQYTKKPKDNLTYTTINNFIYGDKLGSRNDEGNNEGVLSMYVAVDVDGQTSENNIVITNPVNMRNNIMTEGKLQMNFSDGDNNNFTTVDFTDADNEIGFEMTLENQKELLGIVSVSETMDVLVGTNDSINAKRAIIGSSVSIASDTDDLINELLEENDIDFTQTPTSYPFVVAPNFRGVDLFSAIKFLTIKKDKTLLEQGGSFTIKEDTEQDLSSRIFFNTVDNNTEIFSYSREKSEFDLFNEIEVFGKFHKGVRKELRSINKRGKKTLQVFENELTTQEDVDKRALQLLKLHNDESFGLKLNVGHKGVSQLRVGDVVTVEIPQEGITRREFIVLEIQHNLTGTMDLELGSYTKGLEDRFAELAIANNAVNNKIRENDFDDVAQKFDIVKSAKIKPLKFLIRKTEVPLGSFALNTNTQTLNTNAETLNIGVTTITTLVEEEF